MDIQERLEKYGFSIKESRIYDYILHNGDSTALEISRGTHIPRTSVYNALDSLRAQGFISLFRKNGVAYFQLESVSNFLRKTKEKEDAIREIMPEIELLARNPDSKPKIKFYEGKESIRKVLEDILETCKAEKIVDYYSTSDPEFVKYFGAKVLNWYLSEREKIGVRAHVILTERSRNANPEYLPDNELRDRRYIKGDVTLPAFMYIYGNKVAFFSFKNERYHSIIIESRTIKETVLQLFMFVWDTIGKE